MGLIKNAVIGTALNVPIKALDYMCDKLDEHSDERKEKYKNKLFKNHPNNNHIIVETAGYTPKTRYNIYDKDFAPIFYATLKQIKKKAVISIFDMKSNMRACVNGEWINKRKLFEQASISIRAEYGLDNRVGEMHLNNQGIQKELLKYEDWSIDTSKREKEIIIIQGEREIAHVDNHPIRGLYVLDLIDEQNILALITFAISYDVGCTLKSIETEKEMNKHKQY